MNTYFIYDSSDHYLGQVLAINTESASLLADALFTLPHRVLSFRLTYNRRIAA